MKRLLAPLLVCVAALSACESADEAPPPTRTPETPITNEQVRDAVLDQSDVGSSWVREPNPVPSTVQVGGKVGPANVEDAEAEAIAAYKKEGGTAYLTANIFAVDSPEIGQAVMLAHHQAENEETWVQERRDGGGARFKRVGAVEGLPSLGDESYTARMSVTVTDAQGNETKRKIQYVVFRTGRIVAFVIAQDANVEKFAVRQDEKVDSLSS